MKKKNIIRILITLLLFIFSIYYTSKSKDIVKKIDPIMTKIEENKKYEEKAIDAEVFDDYIIPGKKGKTIDKNISYSKMKKYGAYNESLISIKEIKPKKTIDKVYDKYLIQGNKINRTVSLIFEIKDKEKLDIITNYLNKERISGTLLINEELLDEDLSKLDNFDIEILFNKITDVGVSSTTNYLKSITKNNNKFCISKEKDEKLLSICNRYKMHTVVPSIKLNTKNNLKEEIQNGSVIMIEDNFNIIKELDYVIYFIKSKGYTIVKLEKLLSE